MEEVVCDVYVSVVFRRWCFLGVWIYALLLRVSLVCPRTILCEWMVLCVETANVWCCVSCLFDWCCNFFGMNQTYIILGLLFFSVESPDIIWPSIWGRWLIRNNMRCVALTTNCLYRIFVTYAYCTSMFLSESNFHRISGT